MTVVTLVLLGAAAAAAVVPPRRPVPHWFPAAAATILLAAAAVTGANTHPATGFALAATYVLTVAAALTGGSPVVTAVFRLARRTNGPAPDAADQPLHGGRTIGILERSAVAASILAGWPEGIAIVLAVKGLARYPELRGAQASAASEQFIIGTFTSVMWAVAVCGVGQALVT
ncbi:hypothetical protein HQ346_01320 [Rhodococcus sp. BP-252]|uniref:Uncharacterized protein n=1 Tax=Rhodococcoides kyotonense TaxID=398843 RepID=A0A177YGK5_9NOCA|nr:MULTISPECIES: hypothetical protein [Rhodococcus]MBY6410024.1 hypothetical protein [Rhodococcus sp. BP-320]MBY6414993.1 hypothetical protein [Rhodococcus sp. BP-321]MBY6421304.1 hypothetical protein [Rhodococcus sp. BP-324]MBY6425699.1 hypothetical protein [Rhodococcus sp. BP-323]MBY6429889.1 hypothetical protein [Rhodococcus sp. BP-322]